MTTQVPYEPVPLGALLARRARERGSAPFLLWGDEAISFAEADDRARRFAAGLHRLGIGRGDRVCLLLPNCPEFVYAWFGILKLGAVEIPLNTALRGDVLRHALEVVSPRAVVAASRYLDALAQVLPASTADLILLGEDRAPAHRFRGRTLAYRDVLAASGGGPEPDLPPSDHATYMFTSGTTGPSKAVIHSHTFGYTYGWDKVARMGATGADTIFCPLPLFHVDGKYGGLIAALLAGARLALAERFSATRFWDDVQRYRATEFLYLGTIASILFKQEAAAPSANPVRACWGANMPAELYLPFEERFALTVIEVYGSTEGGTPLYMPWDDRRPGTCGRPIPGFQVTILDGEDRELPPGQVGELAIRPDRPDTVMAGYYGEPEQTLAAFRNLWFHTGDLAWKDPEGYVHFVARAKDCIRRGGENISAYEVEAAIGSHPQVAEAAVVAVPSDIWGEEVMVFVVPKGSRPPAPEALIVHAEARLAYFMVPRYVEFLDAIPKTATEKPEKYKLRERGVTARTWDREAAGYKLRRP